jgi:hypothetical protein
MQPEARSPLFDMLQACLAPALAAEVAALLADKPGEV